MSQPVNSSRLTNSTVNINGAANISTNYALASIGVTGNNFDISALSTGNNISIGANGTRNVTIGSSASGTVTFAGATTFSLPINGGVFTGTAINGTLTSTALTIGGNLTGGSVSIAATANANTVTIGNNSTTGTGTVNVGTGSATVNVGNNATTSPTAIVLGRTGGSVTLGPALTLGAAPTAGSNGKLGSYEILTPANIVGATSSMNIIGTFNSLPIGVYILIGSMYINNPTGFASNIQFGLNGTTQNSNLQNLLSVNSLSAALVVRLTTLWVQTSAVNVFFSAAGMYNYENIAISYLRIA